MNKLVESLEKRKLLTVSVYEYNNDWYITSDSAGDTIDIVVDTLAQAPGPITVNNTVYNTNFVPFNNLYINAGGGDDIVYYNATDLTVPGWPVFVDLGNGHNTFGGQGWLDEIVSGTGDDYIVLGDNFSVAPISTNSGNDTVILFGYHEEPSVDTHYGNDYIDARDVVGVGSYVTLFGSWDADEIHGSNFSDDLFAGHGNDLVYGYDGNDYFEADSGGDTIYGGSGNDYINLRDWPDNVADGSTDYVDGGLGTDTVIHEDSFDVLTSVEA